MYSLKNHDTLEKCLSSLSSNVKQVFTPFVEVSIKGHVVLIRKTTAIWLFQETERVSADRLFRVRLKQPYASICTPKNVNTAVIHDQCNITDKDDLKSDDMARIRDTIVIEEDDTSTESIQLQTVEVCTKSNKWLKIGSYICLKFC